MALARELGDMHGSVSSCKVSRWRRTGQRIDPHLDEVLACSRETGDDLLTASQLNHSFSTALHAGRIEEGARSWRKRSPCRAESAGI